MLEGASVLRAPEGWRGAPGFVRAFSVPGGAALTAAVLEVTAEGLVEPLLDGRPVTADVLLPGWTAYRHRLRVATYDVTAQLGPGRSHEIELRAGNGWDCGRLGWRGARALYGDRPGVAAALTLRFDDGSSRRLVTDDAWRTVRTATLSDDLYDGEHLDLRTRRGAAHPVVVEHLDRSRLVPFAGPPIVRTARVAPISAWSDGRGGTIFDFGQNLVGRLRMRVRGPRGHRLTVQHAEVLERGELARRPLRSARAEDVVVLSGGDDDVEPAFTFHGFRYARIQGWRAVEGDVEAVVIGSDLRRTGRFACSDPVLDRFHRNVVWSLRGNTVGIPTDCPQRDERLGWTGDIAVFAPTACFLFDMDGFLREWLTDLRCEQDDADGRVPYVVPDALPGWSVRAGGAAGGGGRLERRGGVGAVGAVGVVGRARRARGELGEHDRARRTGARPALRRRGLARRLPVRGLARSHGSARRPVRGDR
ncbi:family 78 glycoside hydrolase catalytic domain [Microbacterium hominis]|nr:family 78 glycoside hydrolase catalytic domain [Microbacterium hominis]